jgi:hypothetical protein
MLLYDLEEFANCEINVGKQHNNNFRYIKDRNPLTFYGCMKLDFTSDLLYKLQNMCRVSLVEFRSLSTESIYEKLLDDLYKTKLQTAEDLLKGPIYVIVYEPNECDVSLTNTRMLIVYSKYTFHSNHNVFKLQEFLNQHVDIDTCKNMTAKASVYTLNKNNRLYHKLII